MEWYLIVFILGVLFGAYIASKRFRRKLNTALKSIGHNEDDDLYYEDEDE